MEESVYEAEFTNELTHWWFVARREMFGRLIRSWGNQMEFDCLDVGTSTGTNLRLLGGMKVRSITGIEINSQAAEMARVKTGQHVVVGDSTNMPFEDKRFDLVLATDVLEHVENHELAVEEIFRVLKPGGRALVTVPAFMSLWGLQDDLSQHKRRYVKSELVSLLEGAGFTVEKSWYFNFFLAPLVFIARKLVKYFRITARSEGDFNFPLINRVLLMLFRLDCRFSINGHFPFGVSLGVIAHRAND